MDSFDNITRVEKNAPDKIYVTIDRPDERIEYNPELVGVAWSKKDKSCEHIEYIRKGALIDALNKILDARPPESKGPASTIAAMVFQQLIDKISEI